MRLQLLAILFLTLASVAALSAADRPVVGTSPPGFELPSTSGQVFSAPTAEVGQKTLLIFFRGTW